MFSKAFKNILLNSLSGETLKHIAPKLRHITHPRGALIAERDEPYNAGCCSLMIATHPERRVTEQFENRSMWEPMLTW